MIEQAIQTLGSAIALGNNVVNQGLSVVNAGLTATNCLVNQASNIIEETVHQYTDVDMSDIEDSNPLKHLIYQERKNKKDNVVCFTYKNTEVKTECTDINIFNKALKDVNTLEFLVTQASLVSTINTIGLIVGNKPLVVFNCDDTSNELKLKAITSLISLL